MCGWPTIAVGHRRAVHRDDPAASDNRVAGLKRHRVGARDARTRILDAAVEVLCTHGYAAATTLRIQHAAGVTRGCLLHHFPSRDRLLIAAVQHLARARIAGLRTLPPWPADPAGRVRLAVDTMWATFYQPYFWAATELWLAGRSNEPLRQALTPEERRLGLLAREAADLCFGPDLSGRQHYRLVREQLITMMRGVALTYAFDPKPPSYEPHLDHWRRFAATLLVTDIGDARP
ncbi:TetR family transcriptional regulator [Rhodococcus opacus]|nr:TetR/AcrR family transcriptional regulator [Rhodococcus opacus]RKM76544.1 TetR family transcriptional regulator [Rhodococcus opacus]